MIVVESHYDGQEKLRTTDLVDPVVCDWHNLDGNETEETIMENENGSSDQTTCPTRPACPVCGGELIEIRAKLQCSRCHTICETCCEGGPG